MATYEEVKNVPNHPEIFLIDVRNVEEIESTGIIPSSINIPLPNLEASLKQTNDEFKAAHGRDLPEKDALIILTCRSGRRAATAEESLKTLGWTNTKVYGGSWLEWAEKEGLNATEANTASTTTTDTTDTTTDTTETTTNTTETNTDTTETTTDTTDTTTTTTTE